MIVAIVWGSRLRGLPVVLAILAGSQLGHAIVYYARFGTSAASVQATGVHSYLPALTAGLSAVTGAVIMATLLVVAAARSLAPGPSVRRFRATLRFFDLLPALFAVQLLVFMGQESIESLVAGGHLPSLLELLFWGAFGQLPAAAVAAVALSWLLARLESAWAVLVEGVARLLGAPAPLPPARPARPERPVLRLASVFPAAFLKRGPPLCSNS